MATGTRIWVVEFSDPESDVAIKLFADENIAYESAITEALEYMFKLGCDASCTILGWANSYNKVLANKDTNPTIALDAFNFWTHNFVTNELERYSIYVYVQEVIGDLNLNSSQQSVAQKPVKLVDVPCKTCGRNVNTSESTCWFCGTANPARK